jgi:hypothetical protein
MESHRDVTVVTRPPPASRMASAVYRSRWLNQTGKEILRRFAPRNDKAADLSQHTGESPSLVQQIIGTGPYLFFADEGSGFGDAAFHQFGLDFELLMGPQVRHGFKRQVSGKGNAHMVLARR